MIRSKCFDGADLEAEDWRVMAEAFDEHYGPHWPNAACRRWEYVAALQLSGWADTPTEMLRGQRAIEVGAGDSVFAPYVSIYQPNILCTDLRTRGEHHGVRRVAMSMLGLDFPDGYFDWVFAISSLEHVNAGKFALDGLPFDAGSIEALREMRRVCRPGGRVVVTTDIAPNYIPPPGLWPSGSHRIYDWPTLVDHYTEAGLQMVGEANLRFPADLSAAEPAGYAYTVCCVTLEPCESA